MKFIVVCGGVISGTGKGIAAASIALLMKLRGHSVTYIKFDPYIGDASMLRPTEHGETYVLDDGKECDLDLGSVYRIANIDLFSRNICTTGTLYRELIQEQENGKFGGSTCQLIPHMTDKVQKRLTDLTKDHDVVIAEIGGTIGDIESAFFYESIRQLKTKRGVDLITVMVAPILWVNTIQEFKTKPLQNAVKELQRNGLQPDILLCRVDRPVPLELLSKVASLTNVPREAIFDAPDVSNIYRVPIELYDRHVDDMVVDLLHLKRSSCRIHKHRDLVERELKGEVEIGIFGKYANSSEAYISIKEALSHAGMALGTNVKIRWIAAEALEKEGEVSQFFTGLKGVIVPGGFDKRGVEGKIRAIQYVRENKIPFLGICLGLQCAVIEHARNLCGIKKANSQEFDKDTEAPVIHYLKGQENIEKKSGTMRLGAYSCELVKGSISFDLYGKKLISERHRHRLEVNPEFTGHFAKNGFHVAGVNPESGLIEIMEMDRSIHPYFVGTQYHGEFLSLISNPSPLFLGLIKAAMNTT